MILYRKHPAGDEQTSEYADRFEAARHGIADYLIGLGYTPSHAGYISGQFLARGEASADGIDFWTTPDEEDAA